MPIRIPSLIGIIIILLTVAGLFAGVSRYYSKYEMEVAELSQTPTVVIARPEKEPPSVILMFVGDIMLNRGVKEMVYRYGNGDYKFPFLKIQPYLKEADILFGNLESVISDKRG